MFVVCESGSRDCIDLVATSINSASISLFRSRRLIKKTSWMQVLYMRPMLHVQSWIQHIHFSKFANSLGLNRFRPFLISLSLQLPNCGLFTVAESLITALLHFFFSLSLYYYYLFLVYTCRRRLLTAIAQASRTLAVPTISEAHQLKFLFSTIYTTKPPRFSACRSYSYPHLPYKTNFEAFSTALP